MDLDADITPSIWATPCATRNFADVPITDPACCSATRASLRDDGGYFFPLGQATQRRASSRSEGNLGRRLTARRPTMHRALLLTHFTHIGVAGHR